MDPELWLQQAQAALDRGATRAEVEEVLREVSGGKFKTISELKAFNLRPTPQGVADEALQMAQGGTMGWFDELAGVLAGAGAAVVPGGKGFSEARQATTDAIRGRTAEANQRRSGLERVKSEVGGNLLTLGLGGAAARGTGLLRGNPLTMGPSTGPARAIARVMGRGAAGGAAAGAVEGAGRAEGGVMERLPAAGGGAALGGLFGMVAPGIAEVPKQTARAFRGAREVGENIANHLRNQSGRGLLPPSELRAGQRAAQREARASLIQPLEGQPAPAGVTDAFVTGNNSPEVAQTLQAELRAIRNRNPNARQVFKEIGEVQAGKRAAVDTEISFDTADELVRGMSGRASRALRAGRSEEAQNLIAAYETVDNHMRTLPGYSEFKAEWARTSANMRALADGYRKLAQPSRSSDEVLEALQAMPTDEARAMALEGMVSRYTSRLETRQGKAGQVMSIIQAGPDFNRKLRQLFPDDASFQEFQRLVDIEEQSISFAERARVVAGALAYLTAGTSLVARVIPNVGQ